MYKTMVKQHSSSMRMVKGLHRFTLEKFSLGQDMMGHGKSIDSGVFTVGGHQWAVNFFPSGMERESVYNGLYVTLVSESNEDGGSGGGVGCLVEFTLLDQSGKGNHWRSTPNLKGPILLTSGERVGCPSFAKQVMLRCYNGRDYLNYDCLKFECMISVVLPSGAGEEIPTVPKCVDDDDVVADLISMLHEGEGADIDFFVRSHKLFKAHKFILSARSSVFATMFSEQPKQKVVSITDTEPRVFKVFLPLGAINGPSTAFPAGWSQRVFTTVFMSRS